MTHRFLGPVARGIGSIWLQLLVCSSASPNSMYQLLVVLVGPAHSTKGCDAVLLAERAAEAESRYLRLVREDWPGAIGIWSLVASLCCVVRSHQNFSSHFELHSAAAQGTATGTSV